MPVVEGSPPKIYHPKSRYNKTNDLLRVLQFHTFRESQLRADLPTVKYDNTEEYMLCEVKTGDTFVALLTGKGNYKDFGQVASMVRWWSSKHYFQPSNVVPTASVKAPPADLNALSNERTFDACMEQIRQHSTVRVYSWDQYNIRSWSATSTKLIAHAYGIDYNEPLQSVDVAVYPVENTSAATLKTDAGYVDALMTCLKYENISNLNVVQLRRHLRGEDMYTILDFYRDNVMRQLYIVIHLPAPRAISVPDTYHSHPHYTYELNNVLNGVYRQIMSFPPSPFMDGFMDNFFKDPEESNFLKDSFDRVWQLRDGAMKLLDENLKDALHKDPKIRAEKQGYLLQLQQFTGLGANHTQFDQQMVSFINQVFYLCILVDKVHMVLGMPLTDPLATRFLHDGGKPKNQSNKSLVQHYNITIYWMIMKYRFWQDGQGHNIMRQFQENPVLSQI
jgi:hypothetical protein